MNLLLWGAETWSLRKSQLDKLEVFLHQSIRRILQISMTKVQEQRIHNNKVQKVFYSIPCVRNMIAAQKIDFVGKMIQSPPDCPSRNMITACCNHKLQTGRLQTTGKNFMVENLQLLFRDIPTVQIDQYGSLRTWIHKASNKKIMVPVGRLSPSPCNPTSKTTHRLGPSPVLASPPQHNWPPTDQ